MKFGGRGREVGYIGIALVCSFVFAALPYAANAVTEDEPDDTPPTLTLPSDMTVVATSPSGATVNYTVTASDEVDGDISNEVSCSPTSGSVFPMTTTNVSCSVTDSDGQTSSGSFNVTVSDYSSVTGQSADSITLEQDAANADNTFADGWKWDFRFTVPFGETKFKFSLSDLTDATGDTLPIASDDGGNARFCSTDASEYDCSSDSAYQSISAANTFSDPITFNSSADEDTSAPGRQVDIIVEVKVPEGTPAGTYSASYGAESDAFIPFIPPPPFEN